MDRFRLAPMTTDILLLTIVVLIVPAVMLIGGHASPAPMRFGLYGAAGLVAFLYLSVWFWWRPSLFEISPAGLTIVWPLRRRQIARATLGEIAVVGRDDFRRDYGRGMRVGAGGLWGAFGLLITAKETLSMYVSRTDTFVLIRLHGARTLMLTPEHPARFAAALRTPASPATIE